MTFQSKLLTEVLSPEYGYVIVAGTALSLYQFFLMKNVIVARKKFNVKYPDLYSKDSTEFNCIQRAHQNYLEVYPMHMFLLMTGGLSYPLLSAAGGIIYLGGRVAYSKGYSSGKPEKRKNGAFSFIGSIIILGTTLFTGYQLVKSGSSPLAKLGF